MVDDVIAGFIAFGSLFEQRLLKKVTRHHRLASPVKRLAEKPLLS